MNKDVAIELTLNRSLSAYIETCDGFCFLLCSFTLFSPLLSLLIFSSCPSFRSLPKHGSLYQAVGSGSSLTKGAKIAHTPALATNAAGLVIYSPIHFQVRFIRHFLHLCRFPSTVPSVFSFTWNHLTIVLSQTNRRAMVWRVC